MDLGLPEKTYTHGKRSVQSRYVDAAMPDDLHDSLRRIARGYREMFSEGLSISVMESQITGNVGIAAHLHNVGIKFYGNYARLFTSVDMTNKDEYILKEFMRLFDVSKSIRSNKTMMDGIEEAMSKADSRLPTGIIKFMEEVVRDF